MLQTVFVRPITRTVRGIVNEFVNHIPTLVEIRHPIKIVVVPEVAVLVPCDSRQEKIFNKEVCTRYMLSYGSFGYILKDGKFRELTIELAGKPYPDVHANGKQLREFLLWTLCHEISHYIQVRDGKEMNERGVEARAAALLKNFPPD